jgi:hypothetical protein
MRCRRRPGCGFYSSKSTEEWRSNYCNTPNHRSCARYKVAAKGKQVPENLLPTGKRIALSK